MACGYGIMTFFASRVESGFGMGVTWGRDSASACFGAKMGVWDSLSFSFGDLFTSVYLGTVRLFLLAGSFFFGFSEI